MIEVLETPTREEQKVAKSTLEQMEKTKAKIFLSFGGGDSSVAVPQRVVRYLKHMLNNMAHGKGFSLVLEEEDISTQEAADILHVSRPHLVKLLEQGDIPFQKVGRHRRVRISDLQEYERKQNLVRLRQLDFLARQSQELNMGY